jgi:hypothetical protein
MLRVAPCLFATRLPPSPHGETTMCSRLVRHGIATRIRVSSPSSDMIAIICRRMGLSYVLLKVDDDLALHQTSGGPGSGPKCTASDLLANHAQTRYPRR